MLSLSRKRPSSAASVVMTGCAVLSARFTIVRLIYSSSPPCGL
jgi:hypothetical protein